MRFDAQARVLNPAATRTNGFFVSKLRIGPGNPPGFHNDHIDQIGQEFMAVGFGYPSKLVGHDGDIFCRIFGRIGIRIGSRC